MLEDLQKFQVDNLISRLFKKLEIPRLTKLGIKHPAECALAKFRDVGLYQIRKKHNKLQPIRFKKRFQLVGSLTAIVVVQM